jgi:non-ribosomal peptide synthetase component F
VHELFEAQVQQRPATVARVCGEARVCYRELNARASRLANYLGQLGVGREVPVGCVWSGRSR